MRQIRSKDTAPELALRRIVYQMGYRFRLHRKDLPGKPDLVFPGRKKVVFLHGCFWHQHQGCRDGRVPGTRQDYWKPKLARNQERDVLARTALKALGWDVLILWECDLSKKAPVIAAQLTRFLGAPDIRPQPLTAGPKERSRSKSNRPVA